MSIQKPNGFTDYFGDVEPVIVLSYDNDKYCEIMRLSDGTINEIKRGYVTTNKEGTKFFHSKFWWVMGGNDILDYRSRVKTTYYEVHDISVPGNYRRKVNNKQEAIRQAKLVSKRTGEEVSIYVTSKFESNQGYSSSHGCLQLYVHGDHAYQYSRPNGKRLCEVKYLRGHGKCYNNRRPGKKH